MGRWVKLRKRGQNRHVERMKEEVESVRQRIRHYKEEVKSVTKAEPIFSF